MTAGRPSTGTERSLVALGLGLMLLHNADEAFGHPETGGKLNLAVGLVVSVAVFGRFPRMSKPWRVGVLGFLGLQGLVQGLLGHIVPILSGNATPLDDSGILFTLGGALLLGLAVVEAQRERSPRTEPASPSGTALH